MNMNPLVTLAKLAVEKHVRKKEIISPPEDLPEEFLKKSGTFVTIKKGEQLRGCIGTYLATKENTAQEIISNAIATATEDYRFGPIQENELSSLSYTVYLLSKPGLVKDINGLDPKKYGIIIKTGLKTGLLLPDLDGIDTTEQQISIACQKGGIDPQLENIIIYKFTVEKYE